MDLDELFRAARESGSRRAMQELLRALRSELVDELRREVGPIDAEDIAQETLVIIVRKLPEFDPRHDGAVRAWALKIGHRIAVRFKTRGKLPSEGHANLPAVIPAEGLGPLATLELAEQRSLLYRLIGQLTTKYRRTIQQKLAGMEDEEIARREGIRVSSVRVRWFRAARKLQGCLLGERET